MENQDKIKIFLGIAIPLILILTLITIGIIKGPSPEDKEEGIVPHSVESEPEKIKGKEIILFNDNIYNIVHSPYIIKGDIVMEKSADVHFNFHIKRFGRLTAFETFVNDNLVDITVDDSDNIGINLNEIDINEGRNRIKIEIQDFLEEGVGYPAFKDYPLTIYKDSKVTSEKIISANL